MLLATAQAKDGKRMLIIGLSSDNVRELQRGNPIYKPAGAPLEFHLVIEYAETEILLVDKLSEKGLGIAQEAQEKLRAAAARNSDPDPTGH